MKHQDLKNQIINDELLSGLCLLHAMKHEQGTLPQLENRKILENSAHLVLKAIHSIQSLQGQKGLIGMFGSAKKKNEFVNYNRTLDFEILLNNEEMSNTQSSRTDNGGWFQSKIYKEIVNELLQDISLKAETPLLKDNPRNNLLNRTEESVQLFARQINLRNEFNTVLKYSDFPKI